PHKRNPDLFELTRARAAAVEGDLAARLHQQGKLAGGSPPDFQLLKEPLFRGLDRTGEMVAMLAHALPRLGVDEVKGRAALRGDALATDEVMRRVEDGVPFRQAYRAVAEELTQGVIFTTPTVADLVRRRRETGNLGNVGVATLRRRVRAGRQWNRRERARFDRAMRRLGGRQR
ncbi:MAG: argH, partial [Gemmatimonadetes bacterium]|nr:argH [Gemmatimonadota bacterium]